MPSRDIMSGMLSKKDREDINEIVNNNLIDFWEKMLEPYLTLQSKRQDEMLEELIHLRKNVAHHEKRITVLESKNNN